MTLTRYNPWSLFDQLQRELNMPMNKFDTEENGNIATANWAPAVDIKEDDKAFTLLAAAWVIFSAVVKGTSSAHWTDRCIPRLMNSPEISDSSSRARNAPKRPSRASAIARGKVTMRSAL